MNFLQLALELSFGSIGVSRPNPAVGAVVVKDVFTPGVTVVGVPGKSLM